MFGKNKMAHISEIFITGIIIPEPRNFYDQKDNNDNKYQAGIYFLVQIILKK